MAKITTIFLAANHSLTVTADEKTAGHLVQVLSSGVTTGWQDIAASASVSIAPSTSGRSYRLVSDSGELTYTTTEAGLLDDDTMSAASISTAPTSESAKAYIDAAITAAAAHDEVTLNADDPTQETLTLSDQEIQVNLATSTTDGAMAATDKDKLDNIEDNATADQTGAEIKSLYEAEADTNAFTDAEQSKLSGIEDSADVTDEDNVTDALDGATLDADTVSGTDKVLIQDAQDSDVLKTATAQSIADLAATLNAVTLNADDTTQETLTLDGQEIQVSQATTTTDGAMSAEDKDKLDNIEANATADQTGSEIKSLYEGEADTNAFTDAEQSKLSGIEDSADVTDEANVTAALDGATLSAETVAADDKVLIQDTNDSDILKTVTAQSIADLASGHDAVTLKADDATQQTLNLSGQEIQVNQATTSTDGAMSAEDKSKLDDIEAAADVTDATNVVSSLNGATISSATVATGDKVLVQDADDSDNLKTVTAQSIADLGSGMSNPMTTAEDIIVGGASGAPARLAKGTEGQVLSISSGEVAWGDASSGGDTYAWSLVSSTTISGATSEVEFTNLGGTEETYMITFEGIKPTGDTSALRLDASQDNGSTYDEISFYSTKTRLSQGASAFTITNQTGQAICILADIKYHGYKALNGHIIISCPADSGLYFYAHGKFQGISSDAGNPVCINEVVIEGRYGDTPPGAVNAVQFTLSGTTFADGVIALYKLET